MNTMRHWLAPAAAVLASAAMLIVYGCTAGGGEISTYLQTAVCMIIMIALPMVNRLLNGVFPDYLLGMICAHVFISNPLGTVLDFYDIFWWWDLLAHGFFGLWLGLAVYILYKKYGGKINAFSLILIFTATIGVSALWEVGEYFASVITGDDIQRVEESIAAGHPALYDTITDIIIAAAGTAVFYIALLIRKIRKK